MRDYEIIMRNYEYRDINEISDGIYFIDGKPHSRFHYEKGILEKTNPILINNFNKVAKWIADNCPSLNEVFKCRHNPYYWIKLVVENGKAYLEYGSHGRGYDLALSTTETAVSTCGSILLKPQAFKGLQFANNKRLEEFLTQWSTIKKCIKATYKKQSNVYSDSFEP